MQGLEEVTAALRYRIVSRTEVPLRMRGEWKFGEAFHMACDWNAAHAVEDMVWLEEIKDGAGTETEIRER